MESQPTVDGLRSALRCISLLKSTLLWRFILPIEDGQIISLHRNNATTEWQRGADRVSETLEKVVGGGLGHVVGSRGNESKVW